MPVTGGPSAPTPAINFAIVEGTVYDEAGAPVVGATIQMKSLDASVPWRSSPFVTCADGAYLFRLIPEGANVEIVVTKPGWTSRRRVGAFQRLASGRRNVIDFGGPRGAAAATSDPGALAAYVSDRPEVVATTPRAGATGIEPGAIAVTLQLSEALPAAARDAIARAVVLWPANAAAGAPEAIDVAGGAIGADLDFSLVPLPPTIGYVVREGRTFGSASRPASASWNDEGTVLTLAFDAPLRTGRTPARYQLGLVAGAAPILDASGLPLGSGWESMAGGQPTPGHLLAAVFQTGRVALPEDRSAASIWSASHAAAIAFEVAPDQVAPALLGVEARAVGPDFVIAFTYSEPMVAYDGTPVGRADASVAGDGDGLPGLEAPAFLRNYTFALGEREGEAAKVSLDGYSAAGGSFDPTAAEPAPTGVEFAFAAKALAPEGLLARARPGQLAVAVDPADPRRVLLTIKGRASVFDHAAELAVRVERVADPAGNAITFIEAGRQHRVVPLRP